jgi:2-dehydro-3-deoxyglucarate aldolase
MATDLRANPLRERIEADGVALGVLENVYSPALVELYGELGLDFVWLDLEHGGPDPADAGDLEALLRAADATGVEPLVRLPTSDPWMVRKALDAGARSVFLPRVETAAEVRAAVASSRFRYDGDPGDRGLASPRARRWGLADDYVGTEDDATLVGTTVETRAAVENVEDILAVPDLGFAFVGPLDLSVAYGHPGELDHPEVAAAVETVREAALDADVPLAGLGFGMDDVNEKVERGYQLLNLGTTTGALQSAVSGWLDDYAGER